MKLFNLATLAMAATCCVSFAQQPAGADNKVKAFVVFDKDKPAMLTLDKAEGSMFQYTTPAGQTLQGDAAKCKVFLIQTPPELAEGSKLHAAREYKKARTKLAACKTKYIAYASLPGNPSLQAALLELRCAVAQQDWAALKTMTASFPAKGLDPKVEVNNAVMFNVAKLMADISDDAAAGKKLEESATKLLSNNAVKQTDGRVYGWLKYTIGRAQAAQVPQAQVQGRSISEDNKQKASNAIDNLCEAAVSSHGSDDGLAIDALTRAQALLWAMPGVKAFADSHPGKMDSKTWKAAPCDFRDAVAIAVLLKEVYEVKNPALDAPANFFFNEQEGKKKK